MVSSRYVHSGTNANYEIKLIAFRSVNIDYHIQYDNHLYSVPHQLVGEKLTICAKTYLVEMVLHNKRVASHPRNYYPSVTTLPEHMPTAHQKHHQWTGNRIRSWALDIGEAVHKWVQRQLLDRLMHNAHRVTLKGESLRNPNSTLVG